MCIVCFSLFIVLKIRFFGVFLLPKVSKTVSFRHISKTLKSALLFRFWGTDGPNWVRLGLFLQAFGRGQ